MVPDTTSVSTKIIMSNCSNNCEVGLKRLPIKISTWSSAVVFEL